jgi:hypothetical protein
MTRVLRLAPLIIVLVACERSAPEGEVATASDEVVHVVDSVIPMDVALGRFRADLSEPSGLHSGAASRDELVSRMVQALESNDTTAFEGLAVDRAEWAWLYFPTNVLSKPPYELPPALAWFQLQEANRKGVLRALRELGGHEIDYRGYECSAEPTVEGDNRLWTGCRVTLARDGTEQVTLRLFGSILERDGRFAVLTFDNDF